MAENPFSHLLESEKPSAPSVVMGDSTNPFFKVLQKQESTTPITEDDNPFSKLLQTSEGRRTAVTVDDPDSFGSRLGRSFNEFQKSFAEGVGVLGREMDNESLQNWSAESIVNQQRDIESYGTPTRTASFSEGLDQISEADSIGEAISRAGLLAQDMLADALGSVGVPLAAGLAAIPVAAVAGPAVGIGTGLLAPFIIGGTAGAGETKEEALKLGATPEEADRYGLMGGVAIGVLEKVGAGFAVKSLVKSFGKDAVVKELGKEVGEQAAKQAVNKALKFSKDVAKGGLKAGAGESVTEATQEAAQMALAGIAADKGIVPYEGADVSKRLIDAAALGFIGGKAVNVGGTILSKAASAQANKRQDEIETELKRAEETLSDSKTELYKPLSEGKTGNTNKFTNIMRRSTTPLVDFANRDVRANRIVSKFNSFYDDSSSDVGEFGNISEDAFQRIKRVLKVPVAMRDIPKKKMNELHDVMTKGIVSTDERINEAAEILRRDVYGTKGSDGAGLFGKLSRAGLDIGFVEEYLPRVYKFGFGSKTVGKIFPNKVRKAEQILKNNGLSQLEVDEFINNIVDNDGMYVPEGNVYLDNPMEAAQTVPEAKKSFELSRKLNNPTIIQEMEDANLIEKDVRKLTNRYILQASRRTRAKELKDEFDAHMPSLIQENKVTTDEIKHMQDVYSAIQNSYSPIRSKDWRNLNKFNLTYQYILTLPMSAITSLTEPFFILSRVSPKNAIFGGIDAAVNTMRKGLRTILPKISKSRAEREFNSILQGFDASLSERLSNISGIDVPRRFSDRFFKTILLTQVTQLSRDIAFQAGQRAMKEDIISLHKAEQAGVETRGSQQSKRRLLEMGLVDPTQTDIMEWVNGKRTNTPEVVRKAMSKFVDEIIMSPNAVNRPLWMSKPSLAFASQLKGFTMTIGNTVGYRMWKEVFKPLFKLRLPVEEAFRYGLAFSLIAAGTLGTKALKDTIRYGDEDSPWDDKPPKEKLFDAIMDSNIFGPGTILQSAFESQNFGTGFVEAVLGPTVTWTNDLIRSVSRFLQGKPKSLARTIVLATPILNQLGGEKKEELIETVEEAIEDRSESLGDTFEEMLED